MSHMALIPRTDCASDDRTSVEVTDGPHAGVYQTLRALHVAVHGPAVTPSTEFYRKARVLRQPSRRLHLSSREVEWITGLRRLRDPRISVAGAPITLIALQAMVPLGYRTAVLRLAATGPHDFPSLESLLAACPPTAEPPRHPFRILNGPLSGYYPSARALAAALTVLEPLPVHHVRSRLARWRRLLSPPPGTVLELTAAQLDALMHQTLRGPPPTDP